MPVQTVDATLVCSLLAGVWNPKVFLGRWFKRRSKLEGRLKLHLQHHDRKNGLLFVNKRGRPISANKLREKQLHPLLETLSIPRGGFHSMRHGAASSLLESGATPAVVQKQLRHSDARITLGIYGHVIEDSQRDAVPDRSSKLVN